jgi:tRNA (guanine37-N1)-methyltransferase
MLRGQLVDIAKVKSVLVNPAEPEIRRVLLRVSRPEQLPPQTREYLEGVGAEFGEYTIDLDYDYWSVHDVLTSILPSLDGEDPPSSFTQTGHLAHVNLRDEWLPYKHIIGQVIVDKVSSVTTVVNKLNSIHAQFRYFDMEVIAGKDDFVVSTHESGCSFTFDFSKVYWNSRLHTEHDRLLSLFAPGQVVADAMAGVGPFAVPAAKKGAYVLANDLNPESVKWMRENQARNKVAPRLRITEDDARAFIRRAPMEAWTQPFKRSEVVRNRQWEKAQRAAREKAKREKEERAAAGLPPLPEEKAEEGAPKPQTIDHYVMNLPDSALEFLDAYKGSFTPLLSQEGYDRSTPLPLIHVHCFTRELEPETASADICQRATGYLGHPVTPDMDGFNLHAVRRVAPNKDMYCLTFRLPEAVAYA